MKKISIFVIIAIVIMSMVFITGCLDNTPTVSDSGVAKATAVVQTDEAGHTLEQNNIIEKYKLDNDPATIRFVYVVSPYTSKVMLKTAMRGKITSSGKRLTPTSLTIAPGYSNYGMGVNINGIPYNTPEVIQDDGTYGTSIEYLYGFGMDGSMLQIYTGGSVVLVSTKPLTIQDGVINLQYVDESGNPVK